jgi:sugar/nucleoside kinase (ribokinase family)
VSAPRVVVVGDLAVDVLVTPAVPPVAGADVPARIVTTAGGAGANTAAWLAARGVDVTLVARVGDDLAGHAALAELAAAGVRPAVAVDPDAPTATVVVLVGSGGDRTMLSDRGAAARLSPADLPPLDGVDHLHLSGYVLGAASSRDAGLAAVAAARTAGASTSLDPQATGAFPTTLLADLRGVDLLLPNAAELAAFTGSPDPRSAAALLDVAAAVVVTEGRAGATWVGRDGTWTVQAPAVDVVDATGAGDAFDAFDAGLLAAWLSGAGPEAALQAGCAAGAEAVSRRGARPPGSRA